MRISVGDPNAKHAWPHLNGKPVERGTCLVADEDEGFVDCYVLDENGESIIDPGDSSRCLVKRYYGTVEIKYHAVT